MTTSKFSLITLGCKVNQFESEAIGASLQRAGWAPVEGSEKADACIINTCTVTGKASMQSRQAVRKAIKSNPRAQIIVTGCYVHAGFEALAAIKGVGRIVGNADKYTIPEMMTAQIVESLSVPLRKGVQDMGLEKVFQLPPGPVFGSRTRPFLKIQDGCNAFCTYCIVPYTRGRSRSMPAPKVIDHIQALKDAGYHETVLTGIHLGCYGQDLPPENGRLFDLLKQIDAAGVMGRIRLSSVEPDELTGDIIALVADSDCFCHHFHIPFQSGDDDILNKMHRPYSTDLLRDLIHTIRRLVPDAAIGVDLLVGFPGETERAFQHTYDLIQSLPVSYLHVFPFSPRKGTPAADFSNQVGNRVIKERAQIMRQLGKAKKHEFYQKAVGNTVDVLVEEKRDRVSGLLKGVTSNYLTVLLDGPEQLKNTLVHTRVKKLRTPFSLIG